MIRHQIFAAFRLACFPVGVMLVSALMFASSVNASVQLTGTCEDMICSINCNSPIKLQQFLSGIAINKRGVFLLKLS